jgi:hypothetical protein
LDPKLPSRQPSHASGRPSVFRIRTVQGYICPDVMATRPDAHKSSTGNRISFSDTYMGRQLHSSRRQGNTVRTLSLIRQDVEKNCNCPDAVLIMVFTCSRGAIIRTLGQHLLDAALIWYCVERVVESQLHSCPFERPQLASKRHLKKTELVSI